MELEHILSVFDGDPPEPEIVLEYAKQVHEFFRNPLDVSKLDQYIGLAFPEENGLCAFLLRQLTNKKYNGSKEQILQVIRFILTRNDSAWKSTVVAFCKRFKNITNLYWRNGHETAKHQQLALECLIALCENYGDRVDVFDLELKDLYEELLPASEKSSYQPSVRGKMFHLLGLVACQLNMSVMRQDGVFSQLFNHILNTVKGQVESKDSHLEVAILLGSLKAMNRILCCFGSQVDLDSVEWKHFYINVEQIIDPSCSISNEGKGKFQVKRREFQRAGLELVANNANYFAKHLYRDYEQWYKDLIIWSKSNNTDDSSVGRRAMYKFLESVAEHTKTEAEEMQTDAHENFVAYFLKTFSEILNTKNVTRSELLIAIKGVGLLSASCSNSPEKVEQVFNKVMQLISDIVVELNSPVTDKYSGSLSVVSAYLESVGSMLPHIVASVDDENVYSKFLSHLNTIELLSVQLMTFYPDLSERIRSFSHISVFKIADGLRMKHNQLFLPFIDRIINLALSHVISSPTQAELDILMESWNKTNQGNASKKSATSQLGLRGVKAYTQFWINLTSRDREHTVISLYDSIIQWAFSAMGKLDLSLLFETEEDENDICSNVGDITSTMTAKVLKDFHLFVNLVEFLQIFLSKTSGQLFEKWVEVFITEMLLMIEQNPLVSGFYKILTITLNKARELQYFKKDNVERENLFQRCNAFMKTVTNKMNEFRDDLLMAVLELWLSTPDEIIIQNFSSLSLTLKIIFGMGRTCFSLAEHCIEAIERWIVLEEFPNDEIEKLIQSLFPVWQTYFVSTGMESVYLQERAHKKVKSNRNLKANQQDKKLKLIHEELDEATLKKVQLQLLHLIGSFGHLLDAEQDYTSESALAGQNRYLKYAVPFQDIKPDVYLDTLLPRVLALCENSAERQIRTSACEMLHTFVLYFLGYACKSGGSNENEDLFANMFRTILKLGCDGDVLVRQLFNPLTIQSVHWLTKPNNSHGGLIHRIIVEGLVQSENAPLRDFSSACLSEFFNWTQKHDNRIMSTEVLSVIEALSTHAAPQYRLGAVVGFNSIYKEFRLNKDLCSKYTITLLISFVTSLALSFEFEDDSLLIKTTKRAISHLERIMIKYKEQFNIALSGRKKCPDIPVKCPCLKDVAEWLLMQVGRRELTCRQESSRLLKILAPLIRGSGSLQNFLESFQASKGPVTYVNLAEKCQELCSLEKVDGLLVFMDAASEVYSLLGDCGLLSSSILSNKSSIFLSSYERLLKIRVKDICEKYWRTTIRVLCRFDHFRTFFDERVEEAFLKFSIPVSQVEFDCNIIVELVSLWKKSTRKMSTFSHITSNISLNVEEQFEQKSNSELLKNIQWLTVVAENEFLLQMCSAEELAVFLTTFWNIIDKNLYCKDSSGTLQTISVSKSRAVVLEWLLRLYLALEIDKTKVPDAVVDMRSVDVKGSFLQKTTRGDTFQQNMLPTLLRCDEMMNFSKLLEKCKIEKVGTIVEGFLSTLKQNRILKREMGQKVFERVICSWTLLSVNCDRHTVARILSGLASVDIQACRDSQILLDWWCGRELMTARHLDLKEKSEFIGFLGLFSLSKQVTITLQSIEAVKQLCLTDLNSKIIWNEEEGYITKIILQILSVFEKLPKQWKLLEVLILFVAKSENITGKNSDAPVFKEVKKRLVKVVKNYVNNNEQVEQIKICGFIYNTIMEYEDCRHNMAACKLCLVPAVAAISHTAAKTFFREYLFDIIDKANSIETTLSAWHSKTVAFNLMEMLAHRTQSDITKCPQMIKLYQTKLRNEGVDSVLVEKQNVLRAVTSVCIKFKKNTMQVLPPTDEVLRMAVLECNRASFNAVAANLIATSSKTIILEGILIHEDRLKSNFLWENIVDCKMEYNFPVLLEETIDDQSITFSKMRNEVDKSGLHSSSHQHGVTNNRMNLAASSLASEATNYDFTASVTLENFDYYQRIFGADKQQNEKGPASSIPDVTIERNEINKHDCMAAFVATIKKLVSIPPSSDRCPGWVTDLQKAIKSSQHTNVKIFIIGALLNCQHILEPYASYFIDPILSLIVDPTEKHFGSENLNYFIKDIIIMLLTWRETAMPAEDLKRKLLVYVIENLKLQENLSTRQDVFNHNLGIIEKIVEYWATDLNVIPSENIIDMLKNSIPKTGLAICKVILLAKKLPIPDVSQQMKQFCRSLKNSSKPVYCDAAENVGLLLKHLKDTEFPELEKALDFAKTKLNGEKTRPLAFLTMLMCLRKHSPSVIVYFKPAILGFLNNSTLRTEVISLLPTCLSQEIEMNENFDKKEAANNFFADIDGRKMFQNQCTTISEAESGVEILEIFTNYLEDTKKLMKILGWIIILEEAGVTGKLRSRYARCVYSVYKMLKTSETGSYTVAEKSLLRVFVKLFRDQDQHVKEVVDDFWCNSLKKWNETPMLILELMEIVGDQENAIEITLGLIMKRCSAAPDFHKDIFDKPLEDCTFFSFDLDTSWRMRHASFQPLFAESLSSSQNFSNLPAAMQNSIMSQRRSVGKFGVNLLRATLSLANQRFTPTQQGVDSLEPMEMGDDGFQFLSQEHKEFSTSQEDKSQSLSQNDPLASLRKRFYHRREPDFFAKKEVERQKGQVAARIESVRMKRSNVKLTRSYRVGELPDIIIKHSDLLKTVSTLAGLDDKVGRCFLVILFTSMLEGLDRQTSDQQKSKNSRFKDRAQEVFETLLKNYSRMLKPDFAAALFEISILNGIPIRPCLVSDVCSHLDLYELGILELERYVNEEQVSATHVASKRARLESHESEDISAWLRIAEFYKDLEEYDVLRNIFAISSSKAGDRGNIYDNARAALSLEAKGNVEAALEKYSELYHDSKTKPEQYNFAVAKFLEDSVMNCLASLSSWEQLYEVTEQFKESICNDQIFEDTEFIDRILPFTVQSGLQILFEESENMQHASKYKSFMLESEEDAVKFLNNQYPIEMAVLMLSDDFQNTARSASLLEKGWDRGVKEFQIFSELSLPQRRQRTLMLQQASVLQDILTWCKGLDLINLEQKTKRLSVKSERSCNYKFASLVNCDMVVAERSYFLCKIMEHKTFENKQEIIKELKELNFSQHLWVLGLGLRERNLTVTNKYLGKSRELGEAMSETDLLKWKRMYISYLTTFSGALPVDEWMTMWLSIWKKIDRTSKTPELVSTDDFQMQGELLRSLIEVSLEKEHLVNAKCKTRINQVLLGKSLSQNGSSIVEAATQRSTHLADRLSGHSFEDSSTADQAFFQMFNLLRLLLKSFPEKYGEDESLMQLMLNSLLRSMESDKGENLLLIPCILALLEKFPCLHTSFTEGVKSVPTWIFLPWLDQIVTLYRSGDSSLQPVFLPVLTRLKETYPHAFQLQYMDVLKTSSEIQEMYSRSLKALVLPITLYKSYMENITTCIKAKNLLGAEKILIEFRDTMMACENSDIYGKIHKEYATEMTKEIETVLEKLRTNEEICSSSSNVTETVSKDSTTDLSILFSNVINYHNQKVKESMSSKGQKHISLKDLSPWLAKFHHTISNEEVEIPGFYDGLCKPDLSFHPKVVSFFPTVAVFTSLTKPLRYTMLGNDGKKVDFLAKQGDDLRQDRRIQQLLRISNTIFSADCKTHKRKLHIMTYSVIPMTKEFGIVQMVNQTVSLGSFICSSKSLQDKKIESMIAHRNWIYKTSALDSNSYHEHFRYLNSALNVSRVDAEKEFDSAVSGIPRNLLNDHLQERAKNLEHFFKVRQYMIRSYAAMCIVHWFLGIGDRHLENCLLSLETGSLVGIDFGRAFGTGNTELPIPEMIPFRLTPQLQSLMSPYGCKGLFKETMLHGWRCLINSSELLLSILDIFVNERNINWSKERKRPAKSLGRSEISLTIMEKKLKCKNPVIILLEEIESNSQKHLVPAYSKCVKDGREKLLKTAQLTDEEVVDVLIDMAIDKNLLCRIYHGFCSWI